MTWREYGILVCKLCLYDDITNQKDDWIRELADWVLHIKHTKVPSKYQLEAEYFSAFESFEECNWTVAGFLADVKDGKYEQLSQLPPGIEAANKVYAFANSFQPWCLDLYNSEEKMTLNDAISNIYDFTLIK